MAIDFSKDVHILAVHGVQVGTDADIKSDQQIRMLVDKSLATSHLRRTYAVHGFFYEDINDEAQEFYTKIATAISRGKPLTRKVLASVVDVAGDVVTAARNTSTARKIRNKLRKKILESYNQGHRLLIVSHSLGTIYSLDAVCELMRKDGLFQGDDRSTWPVQGLVTMGSPLGLDLDFAGTKLFEKRNIEPVPDAQFEVFPWHNYFNRLDPVVSGHVFGSPVATDGGKGPVERRYGADMNDRQWLLRGHAVVSGKQWLFAHTAYWRSPRIGNRIINMLWG